jgi:hypothetical protein
MGTEYISMYEACSNETHLGLFWAKEWEAFKKYLSVFFEVPNTQKSHGDRTSCMGDGPTLCSLQSTVHLDRVDHMGTGQVVWRMVQHFAACKAQCTWTEWTTWGQDKLYGGWSNTLQLAKHSAPGQSGPHGDRTSCMGDGPTLCSLRSTVHLDRVDHIGIGVAMQHADTLVSMPGHFLLMAVEGLREFYSSTVHSW